MNTKLFVGIVGILVLLSTVGVYVLVNRSDPAPTKTTSQTAYTAGEVRRHNTKADCWTIISGEVYDITSYIPRHPGGDEILRACGNDSTRQFQTRTDDGGKPVGTGTPHSKTAQELLQKLKIGVLKAS